MILNWIIGRGGLLGSALAASAEKHGHSIFVPNHRFCWQQPHILEALGSAASTFFARATGFEGWQIHWAAGVGTMGSAAQEMAHEIELFEGLLALLQRQPGLQRGRGTLSFASSAGGIYAGCFNRATEATPPAPLAPYGRAKLAQEQALCRFQAENPGLGILIARLSTLYGVGQSRAKRQGLISHMARALVRNQPIQIYVPMDTIRDYILVEDVAEEMLSQLQVPSSDRPAIRIIASERPTTISEIVSTFRRITRRAPRIAVGTSHLARLYSRRAQYQSLYQAAPKVARTPLLIGIAKVLEAELKSFACGRLETQGAHG